MPDKLERFIKLVYRQWRSDRKKGEEAHPDEEALSCFLEARLPQEEGERIKTHILSCDRCAEAVALSLGAGNEESAQVPQELLERVEALIAPRENGILLEIALMAKEKMLEIINTTGDILMGQELVPAPILRSRNIKDFKDEVTILKDFKDVRVQVKVENKGSNTFSLFIIVKDRHTQKIIKDLRVSLLKEDYELESYIVDNGSVIFEHVFLGKYKVEVSSQDAKLASVLLEIKA